MITIWPTESQVWLLKACLFSGHLAEEAWKNWRSQVDFDAIDPASHKLVPLVARNSSLLSLDDPILEKCKGIYRYTWTNNQLRWNETLPALAGLIQAGVDQIVLLKGMAMLLYAYRDFGLRVMGDIDILIKKSQVAIGGEYLQNDGWKQTVSRFDLKNPAHLDSWHAINFTRGPKLALDLHWSIIQENCPSVDAAVLEGAEQIAVDNLNLYLPKPTDLLLQTCVHGMKYSPIPLIRWIADSMTILKISGPQIDWERLIDLAKQARVCNPLSLALQYLREQFDAPIPQTAIQTLQKAPSIRLELLEYQLHARGYGEIAGWYRYCLNRGYFTVKSRVLNIYKYLQTKARLPSAWLIPPFAVYWVCKRLFRFLREYLRRSKLIRTALSSLKTCGQKSCGS